MSSFICYSYLHNKMLESATHRDGSHSSFKLPQCSEKHQRKGEWLGDGEGMGLSLLMKDKTATQEAHCCLIRLDSSTERSIVSMATSTIKKQPMEVIKNQGIAGFMIGR